MGGGQRRPRTIFGAVALVSAVVACSPSTPSESTASTPSDQPANAACSSEGLDLRSPSGSSINLTGIWQANDGGLYDIQHEGRCVFWQGQSQSSVTEPGVEWTNVFVGTLDPDFTFSGSWGDVPTRAFERPMIGPPVQQPVTNASLGDGELRIRIQYDDSDTQEQVFLSRESWTGDFYGSRWVLESSMPPITETVGTFDGKEGDCFWVEANGTRYQFSLPSPNLVYSANPVSIQDSFGNVLFLSGDPIRVAGRANALLGSDCQPSFILSTAVSEPT